MVKAADSSRAHTVPLSLLRLLSSAVHTPRSKLWTGHSALKKLSLHNSEAMILDNPVRTISQDNVYKYCALEINLRCSILIIDLLRWASLESLFFPLGKFTLKPQFLIQEWGHF